MSSQPPPRPGGWRQKLRSLASGTKGQQKPGQSSRASSSSSRQRDPAEEGYLTDTESPSRRDFSIRRASSRRVAGAPDIPPVPPLPSHLRSKSQGGPPTVPARGQSADSDAGYSTDGSIQFRPRRGPRTIPGLNSSTSTPARSAPPTRPTTPASASSSARVRPPCVSDSDEDINSSSTARRSSVTAPAGPNTDIERRLQDTIPYPLSSFGEEARRLEKYMYCGAYYTNAPYRKPQFRGPSIHETRRTHGPRTALDVGCGYGYWIRDASAFWPQTTFVGFDVFNLPHVAMMSDQLTKVSFKQGNLLDPVLPFNNGQFDYIRLANMRLAIPDDKWHNVLQKLSRLLSENGILEILDDGWSSKLRHYNGDMAAFDMSWEEHFVSTLEERGYDQLRDFPSDFEKLIERPLRRIDSMLEWRWRRTLFLAEQAIRNTLIPIVERVEADPGSLGAKLTAQQKHDMFSQDLDDLVGLLRVTPNAHRYRPSGLYSLIYRRQITVQQARA